MEMTRSDLLALLKDGPKTWNSWRESNPHIKKIDLSGVTLRNRNLHGINLSNTNLSEANLAECVLYRANFDGANLYKAYLRDTDLDKASMNGANFLEADLRFASMRMVTATRTIFAKADLRRIELRDSYISLSNFGQANLMHAKLSSVNLEESNFFRANLISCLFFQTNLNKVSFKKAQMKNTVFSDLNLSRAEHLNEISHKGPSSISIDTLYESRGQVPTIFLKNAGVSSFFIGNILPHIRADAMENDYFSIFLCYAAKDRAFVDYLYKELDSKNIRIWYAPESLNIGEHYPNAINDAIKSHEKFLLVLSNQSVNSSWVEREVLHALEIEAERNEPNDQILIPIRIDDAVHESNKSWVGQIRRKKQIGDFCSWQNKQKFNNALLELLTGIRGNTWAKLKIPKFKVDVEDDVT